MRRLAALAALAALLVLSGCGRDNGTSPKPAHGPALLIGFASNRPPSTISGYDQYFYDPSSGDPSYLPPNLNTYYDENQGGFSADGHWYVFTSTRVVIDARSTIYLYDVRAATVHLLSTPGLFAFSQNPTLSGDGHYLAFHYTTGGDLFDQQIALMDARADTLIPTPNLHLSGAGEFDPALSGDGKLIAFTSNRNGSLDVFLYSVPGDSIVPLPGCNTDGYSETGVSISADGRYVAFHSNRPGGVGLFDVYVYDRQTASLLPMPGANTVLSELNPALSPDGRYVAYETENDGAGDIRLYDLLLQRLVPVPGLNSNYFLDRYPTVANKP